MNIKYSITAIGIVLFAESCSDRHPIPVPTPPTIPASPVVQNDNARDVAIKAEKEKAVQRDRAEKLAHQASEKLAREKLAQEAKIREITRDVEKTMRLARSEDERLAHLEETRSRVQDYRKKRDSASEEFYGVAAELLQYAEKAQLKEELKNPQRPFPELGEHGILNAVEPKSDVKVPLGRTQHDYSEFLKAVRANDLQGAMELMLNERLLLLPSGTRILKIDDPKEGPTQVRLLSGDHSGETGWTDQRSWVVKD